MPQFGKSVIKIDEYAIIQLREVRKGIQRYADTVIKNFDRAGVWDIVKEEISDAVEEKFNTGGYGRWKPLSPEYAKWKQRHYPGQKMLVREGTLKAAATGKSGHSVIRKGPNWFEYGVKDIPYAAIHELGGRVRKKTSKSGKRRSRGGTIRIPQREYLSISVARFKKLRDRVKEYLAQRFGKEVFRFLIDKGGRG